MKRRLAVPCCSVAPAPAAFLRSFGLLHCGIRSRRHCGARMAAPGTAIVENERDGQHWGRHLPHGVTVAQLLGSNLESGDRARE